MMEGAETRTFRHLKSAQIEVWRPAIDVGRGRLVGTAGDAMLAEFGSAVSAVGAAIDIQERMARFNEALNEEQRMLFRIGVHLGEVIIDDEDQNIFGDGVNLAARIQAIAEPGGIAVSRAVRDLVELRVEYAFHDGGEHQLKNVSRSVQVFHVRPARQAPGTTTRMVPQITLRFEGPTPRAASISSKWRWRSWSVSRRACSSVAPLISANSSCRIPLSHAGTPNSPSPARRCRSRTWARPTVLRVNGIAPARLAHR